MAPGPTATDSLKTWLATLPGGRAEGLNEALAILDGVEGVGVTRFTDQDVVRHPLVARIVAAYNRQSKS